MVDLTANDRGRSWMSNKETVIAALRNDAAFCAKTPSEQRPIIEAFAAELPEILKEQMDLKVTLKNFLNSKVAILAYVLEGDRLEKLLETAVGGLTASLVGGMVRTGLSAIMEQASEIVANIPSALEDTGTTEDELMLGERVGLIPTNAEKYKAGTLTISDLVYTQPFVLIDNSSD